MSRPFRRLTVALICAGLCLVAAASARAQVGRFYLASYLGLNTFNSQDLKESTTGIDGSVNYKNAVSFAGALGLRLNRAVRVEGEISYRNAHIDNVTYNGITANGGGRDKTTLYMANVYYDLPVSWKRLTPFVTAGIGLADHDRNFAPGTGLPSSEGSSMGFAWQAGAGLLYRISPNFAFTGDYKYLKTSDVKTDNYTMGYGSHEFRVGVQYDLPVGLMK